MQAYCMYNIKFQFKMKAFNFTLFYGNAKPDTLSFYYVEKEEKKEERIGIEMNSKFWCQKVLMSLIYAK